MAKNQPTGIPFDNDDEAFLDEVLLGAVPPAPPPSDLKAAIFARIDETPPASTTDEHGAEVISLHSRRKNPLWIRGLVAAAAAVVLFAGGLYTSSFFDTQPTGIHADSAHGIDQMHEIMAADDMQQAKLHAAGASLDIVSSETMSKAGALVQGAAQLHAGMGAQVWSVNPQGEISSAGVIGPEDHKDVWMPFTDDAVKVFLTEEPMAGSDSPTGRMLGEIMVSK
ncbi:MAG: anti-sigma factor [Corynebacterium sp.]|uniref:anti-sigma factor n=1 Tax=Corynebacterium sp. TaxID=1720 RepID=UPI0026DC4B28|nr:anti-sigma factor [Corynebacterium sp.]MDO4762693.1 anti-sigma factor [Corynebacterium sp.]